MKNVILFTQSFNRPNLSYEVRTKNNKSIEDMASFIMDTYPRQTGIIYCLSKSECERTAEQLNVLFSPSGLDELFLKLYLPGAVWIISYLLSCELDRAGA